ncbi:hypothetical protein Taro_021283 [Colocasia esculenta]|uniref:Uncharacterized protein n=1 Tax=Colocasia esculenta TaxID=4460 RepID=A0A843UQZ2_COLES|nr:hypothetical protein [Colocasia esculenta]
MISSCVNTMPPLPPPSPSSPLADPPGEPLVMESWERLLGNRGKSLGEGWDNASASFRSLGWSSWLGVMTPSFLTVRKQL